MNALDARDLIATLGLTAHPEGGHYRRLFESPARVATERGSRPAMTAIYYLLEAGDFSAWHRLRSHELWHWHRGGTFAVHQLSATGDYRCDRVGPDHTLVLAIPPATWFAAEVLEGDWGLVSCTVAPGFDFADFELGRRKDLTAAHPDRAALIRRLSRF